MRPFLKTETVGINVLANIRQSHWAEMSESSGVPPRDKIDLHPYGKNIVIEISFL